jgi:hypothetical protein
VLASALEEHKKRWTEFIDQLRFLLDIKTLCHLSFFWYTLILSSNWFNAFEGQPRMAVLVVALMRAVTDVLHFLIVFLICFTSFALGGHLLFGPSVGEWNTFASACSTCFRAAFGNFDFMAIYTVSPALAGVWFWTFMIVMGICMFNLILGIVTLTFGTIHMLYGDCASLGRQLSIVRREQIFLAMMSLIPGVTNERLRFLRGLCRRRKKSQGDEEEEESEYYEFGEDGDDFLHGDDVVELENMLWQKFESVIEKEEIQKRGGRAISQKELRKIMPSDAFSLRLFNNQRRLRKELSAAEVRTVKVVDIRYLTGLTKAQANLLLIRVHEEYNTDVDPEKLRNRLIRIATAKCNQQVFSLLGRSIDFNILLKNFIKSVEARTDSLIAAGGDGREQFLNQTATLSEIAELYAEAKKLERQDGPAEAQDGFALL